MAKHTYHPERGDFVHLNFSPSTGHEQAQYRYGLVLSTASFARKTGFAFVCPMTATIRRWPFEVFVPAGHLPPKGGVPVDSVVLTDQLKSLDYRERGMAFVGKAPQDVLNEALAKVNAIIRADDAAERMGR